NILVSEADGSVAEAVYLTDFGLMKQSASATQITGTGMFVGTIDYAAPEQLQAGSVDGRTDVYALGCGAFEALVGRVPFQGETPIQVITAHLLAPFPSASALRPELPTEVDPVL